VIEHVVDVCGVPLLVRAPDPSLARLVTANLRGFPETDARPVVSISIDRERALPPERPPDDVLLGVGFWQDHEGMVVASGQLVVRAQGDHVVAHLPAARDGARLEDLSCMALAWLLGPRARFVLHGGALARGGRAVIVLGHTGSGKSTLAAACLEAGWQVLADDQVVVDASGSPLVVHGLHQSPAVPREIGGTFAMTGIALGDPRDRAQLSRDVLSAGGVPVVGVVLITHSELTGGHVGPAAASTVFPLLLQSFAGTIDPRLRTVFFPVAGDLTRLPGFTVGLSSAASVRRACAVEAVETVLGAIAGGGVGDAAFSGRG
jgi:hypothetical protein